MKEEITLLKRYLKKGLTIFLFLLAIGGATVIATLLFSKKEKKSEIQKTYDDLQEKINRIQK